MYALVMGGTEFVGKNLAKYLIDKGYCVDIFTRGIKPLTYRGINAHLIGDRSNIEELHQKIGHKKYDCVFDISAYTQLQVKNLLEVLDKTSIKRYIFCSSGAVYTSTNDFTVEEAERGETPSWGMYGLDKMQAEDYLLKLFHSTAFPIIIFRPTYIYGEENNLYREAYFFEHLLHDLPIAAPESNQTKTQFLHINDLIKTFESAVHNPFVVGQVYNITYPEQVSWFELVKIASGVLNKSANIITVPSAKIKDLNISVRDFFPFRDITYLLSTEKLQNSGLHVPQINLSDGLQRAYHWYQNEKPVFNNKGMKKLDLIVTQTHSNNC